MAGETALETQALVVHGDRSELRLEAGRITLHKDATTQAHPTEVTFGVDQVRGATLEAPPRGGLGWLHLSVVGGSPPPPSGLAATGDPYTLPVTSRSAGQARKLVKMVERHVQTRGLPHDTPTVGRSTGVVLNPGGAPSPKTPYRDPADDGAPSEKRPSRDPAADGAVPPEPPLAEAAVDRTDLVGELRQLADLHAAGALSDDEFQRAKDRLLG